MRRGAIPIARVRELLDYEPETGFFRWKVKRRHGISVGHIAGSENSSGYIQITIDGRLYVAHRIAWVWVHGSEPPDEIDHINGVRDDNRIANLRAATHRQNSQNRSRRRDNESGFKGVHLHRKSGRWRALIYSNGRNIHLGLFATREKAYAAYVAAARQLFGDFARAA